MSKCVGFLQSCGTDGQTNKDPTKTQDNTSEIEGYTKNILIQLFVIIPF